MIDELSHHDQLRQLTHDVQNCLHVIGIGVALLERARENAEEFNALRESIDHERRQANKLVLELRDAALQRRDGE